MGTSANLNLAVRASIPYEANNKGKLQTKLRYVSPGQ